VIFALITGSQFTGENVTSYKGNAISYKGKYHNLQVKMSPVIREMPSVITGDIFPCIW
jgi:hypothetical protein